MPRPSRRLLACALLASSVWAGGESGQRAYAGPVVNAAGIPALPALFVDGPYLRRSDTREAVQLKGVNVASHSWDESRLLLAKSWGANLLRLIIDVRYIMQDPALRQRLKDTVSRARELGMYVIFDPHEIGGGEAFPLPTDEVVDAMRSLAQEYKDSPHTFYGLWNEPHPDARPDLYGTTLEEQWQAWIPWAIKIAQAIRDQHPAAILVVPGGRMWSRDFRYYEQHPLPFANVIFDVHDYGTLGTAYKRDWWTWMIGKHPIVFGEFGALGYYDPTLPFNGPADVAYFREVVGLVNANPALLHYAAHHFGSCYRGLDMDTCLLANLDELNPSPRGQVIFDDLRTNPPTDFSLPVTARTISIDDRTVAEGSALNAVFRILLSSASALTVTVQYATANDTALAGSDYTTTTGTLTFTPGRTQASVFVPITTDTTAEGNETFFVDLGSPTNATLAAKSQGVGTIQDPPTVAKSAMYRSYNRSTDYHFFTSDKASKDFAVGVLGFQDESNPPPFYVSNVQLPGSVPLFRMYNPNLGRHFYTASASSRDFLMAIGAVYEKDEGFVYPLSPSLQPAGTTELFLLYNNNSGTHLFTADAAQKDGILNLFKGVWVQHTSVGYVFTSP